MDPNKLDNTKIDVGELGTPPKELSGFGEIEVIYKKTGNPKITDQFAVIGSLCAYTVFKHHWDPDKIYLLKQLKILYLDRREKAIALLPLFQGGTTSVNMDLNFILAGALKLKASSIILAHNDPSGSLTSSDEILDLTRKLRDAAHYLGIYFWDHLIISPEGYDSVLYSPVSAKEYEIIRAAELTPEKLDSIPEIDLVYKKRADHEISSRPEFLSVLAKLLNSKYMDWNMMQMQERFGIFFLDAAQRVLEMLLIMQSNITLITDSRFIIKRALELATVHIGICHILPSEKWEPSKEHLDIIRRFKRILNDFNIELSDCVILYIGGIRCAGSLL